MNHPSISGTSGRSTTLLFAAIMVALWMAATGRVDRMVAAFNGKAPASTPPSGNVTPTQSNPPTGNADPHPAFPVRGVDGSWTVPGINPQYGPLGSAH